MKTKTTTLGLCLGILLFSCKKNEETKVEPIAKTYKNLQKADWLIGEWGSTYPDGGVLTETWIKDNDSTFSAKTFFVTGKDTVFSEVVSLEERAGKLNYIANASGQNEGKPVAFELVSATGSRLVFENPKHDYPQKITYNKFENDSISAEIWGMKEGKQKSEIFPLKKLK